MPRVLIIATMLFVSIGGADAQSNHTPAYPTNQHTPAYPTNQHAPAYPKSTKTPTNPVTAPTARKPAPTYYLTLIFRDPNSFPRTAVVKLPECTSRISQDASGKAFRCVQSTPLKPQTFESYRACEVAGEAFRAAAADPQRIISSFNCRKSSRQ